MSYFEVHYMLPNEYDVFIIGTYRGRKMRSRNTAEKALAKLKAEKPQAYASEIAEYDAAGNFRID
jgi:hypothetical protein